MPIEPEPPDFERLPPRTKQLFEERRHRLPIGHLHSRIDADAMM
jgi:hypothetical protein